jgi:prepilin-type N-terminal cleavage/methylation domain-containing protein
MTNSRPLSAFSLIEVLVTVALIGVIVALLVPRFMGMERQSRIRAAERQVTVIDQALKSYVASLSTSEASNIWGPAAYPSPAFISNFQKYLSEDFFLVGEPISAILGFVYHTELMRSITGRPTNTVYIQNSSDPSTTTSRTLPLLSHACVFFFWDPAKRTSTQPYVMFFYQQ